MGFVQRVAENINASEYPIIGWTLVGILGLNLTAAIFASTILVMRGELSVKWTKVDLSEIVDREDYTVFLNQIRTVESAIMSAGVSDEGLSLPPIVFASPQGGRAKRPIRHIRLLAGLDARISVVFAGKNGPIWRRSCNDDPTDVYIERRVGKLPGVVLCGRGIQSRTVS